MKLRNGQHSKTLNFPLRLLLYRLVPTVFQFCWMFTGYAFLVEIFNKPYDFKEALWFAGFSTAFGTVGSAILHKLEKKNPAADRG